MKTLRLVLCLAAAAPANAQVVAHTAPALTPIPAGIGAVSATPAQSLPALAAPALEQKFARKIS